MLNSERFNNAMDAYTHMPSPKGVRELPTEWVDAISYAFRWLYSETDKPKIPRCKVAKFGLGAFGWGCDDPRCNGDHKCPTNGLCPCERFNDESGC